MVPKAERQNLGWHGPLVPWWHGGMVARGHGAMVPNPLLVPWSHGAKSLLLGGQAPCLNSHLSGLLPPLMVPKNDGENHFSHHSPGVQVGRA